MMLKEIDGMVIILTNINRSSKSMSCLKKKNINLKNNSEMFSLMIMTTILLIKTTMNFVKENLKMMLL